MTAQIGKGIRGLGVYCDVLHGDTPLTEDILGKPGGRDSSGYTIRGIVLSGSQKEVFLKDGLVPDPKVYSCGLPILGIGYGLQRMNLDNGGLSETLFEREYGHVEVSGNFPDADEVKQRFFAGLDRSVSLDDIKKGKALSGTGKYSINSWMSHGDTLTQLAPGFKQYGTSKGGLPALLVHDSKPWFGLDFHPEANDCERGPEILAAFVFGVAGCTSYWSMEYFAEVAFMSISEQVEKNPVVLLVSGGVDSMVLANMLLKVLDPDKVHLMYMDTGLMRKDETKSVKASLESLGAKHIHIIRCEREFLMALMGIKDPETKRKTIGDLFMKIQEREMKRLGLDSAFLAQGTIYPDLVESGKGMVGKAGFVKSHHNVGSPLVEAKRESGQLIEPLDRLYKDEVRTLGRLLGMSEDIINRHPYPGPGLAVRILGEVSQEKCEILRAADAIFIEELKKRKGKSGKRLYDEIWQAFAVLLPLQSVAVAGDKRKDGWVLSLRAVTSIDAMTAGVYPFETKDLLEISALITDSIKDISRVTYDISNKPPATIEWE